MTLSEHLVEAAGAAVIAIVVIGAVFELPQLPAVFPLYIGSDRRPDGWGTPNVLALLPAIAAVIYVALSVLQRFPEVYHYRTAVTEANAAVLYRRGRWLVRAIKIAITLIFATVFYFALRAAEGSPEVFRTWHCEPREDVGLECWPGLSVE
jgi:hypothetical protein